MTPYSIAFDPKTAILEAKVEGFWDAATIARFASDLAATMANLRAAGTVFGVLGDASRFSVQAQEIAQGLTRMVDAGNQVNRAPSALVVDSALVKMQAVRTMAADHVRIFANRDDALAWLNEKLGRAQ